MHWDTWAVTHPHPHAPTSTHTHTSTSTSCGIKLWNKAARFASLWRSASKLSVAVNDTLKIPWAQLMWHSDKTGLCSSFFPFLNFQHDSAPSRHFPLVKVTPFNWMRRFGDRFKWQPRHSKGSRSERPSSRRQSEKDWTETNLVHDLVFVNSLGNKKIYFGGWVRLRAMQVQPTSDGGFFWNSLVIFVKGHNWPIMPWPSKAEGPFQLQKGLHGPLNCLQKHAVQRGNKGH